jgi:thioredoxin reductase (NADPH)
MHDVIIIGSGPAGVSAAIYTARAGLNTAIISANSGMLAKADRIENYYGFAAPVSGAKLIADGLLQAKRVGVEIISDQVVSISYETEFSLRTNNDEYKAQSVIIATGSNRTAPQINGFSGYEGKGISYCAVCDAFFYKGKDVAVLGCCEYALHEALELLPIAKSVTLLTNGADPIADIPSEIQIITKKIIAFEGNDSLEGARFLDGSTISVAGIFVAIGVAGSSDLAKKLGAQTEGLRISVDANMATNVPGLYAAGDCTGGMMQIAKAVCEGAKAGIEVIKFIRERKAI